MHSLRDEASHAVDGREKKSEEQDWLGKSYHWRRGEIRQRSDETDPPEHPGDKRRCDRARNKRCDQLVRDPSTPIVGQPGRKVQSPQLPRSHERRHPQNTELIADIENDARIIQWYKGA
jgi:hypothetical protein